jgi:hypothetical protein
LLLLLHRLSESFLESETRWHAKRPLGGLVRLRKLINSDYDAIEQWAKTLSEETDFSLANMDGCLPARLPIFGSKGSSTTGGEKKKKKFEPKVEEQFQSQVDQAQPAAKITVVICVLAFFVSFAATTAGSGRS